MDKHVSKRNIGVNFIDGRAEVALWSPLARHAELIIHEKKSLPLSRGEYGYWQLITDEIKAGDEYWFSVDNGDGYPDPASLAQLKGVHGPSSATDLHFEWTDKEWKNVPLAEYIIYELHTGTFSPDHTFAGIAAKLDYLATLGITAIEIMPVGQFPGSRNWGYDGVFPFAVQDSYGGARELQQLINECHRRGLAVILDVIYNHIGPEGNYLPQFGPYFTDKYFTPWGKALNFDDAWNNGVRDYFIENALMWFRDFHVDALRLDAVHAIKDLSVTHLIKDIRQHTDLLQTYTGQRHYLIAELDLNDPKFIDPYEKGGYNADAQWVDEFHHSLRVAGDQPREGYYEDFSGIMDLVKSYNNAYVYDGQFSAHRKKFFGKKTDNPGSQFIVFSQNHDQTGNRMLGERTSTLVSFEMLKLMAGAVLVSPFIPMLFMGEEWGEPNPFLYFIDHTDKELAAVVNKGRKAEFAYFNWQEDPPDPRLQDTFERSCLQWDLRDRQPHQALLNYYKMFIALRKSHSVLRNTDRTQSVATADENRNMLTLERRTSGGRIICFMNFSKEKGEVGLPPGTWQKLADSASPQWNGPQQAPDTASGPVMVQPESILIYEQK